MALAIVRGERKLKFECWWGDEARWSSKLNIGMQRFDLVTKYLPNETKTKGTKAKKDSF